MSFVFRASCSQTPLNDLSNTSDYLPVKGFADDQLSRIPYRLKSLRQQLKEKQLDRISNQTTELASQLANQKWMSVDHTIHCLNAVDNAGPPVQKPTSIFLSSTVRDILPKVGENPFPGPGHYLVERVRGRFAKQKKNSEPASNTLNQRSLCQYLNSSYSPVASIPSDSRRFAEKKETSFIVGKVHESLEPQGKQNQENIGGNSAIRDSKGTNFHLSKVQRKVFEPRKEVVQAAAVNNNQKGAYLSDVSLNIKQNSTLKTYEPSFKRGKLATASTILTQPRDSDSSENSSEEEYIQTTPGPGSYNYESSSFVTKDFRSKRQAAQQVFFNRQERLKETKTDNTLGPTSYDVKPLRNPQTKPPKNVGFLAKEERFKPVETSYGAELGLYHPRNSIENDLINELVKGFKGRFGTNVERFQKDETFVPGPGTYNMEVVESGRREEQKSKLSHPYKSTVKRCLFENIPNFPGPGDYEIDRSKIAELHEHEDLKPKQAPFNTSSSRTLFVAKPGGEENGYCSPKQPSKEEHRNSSPFKSKSPRFPAQPFEKTPGAGEYYDQKRDLSSWEIPTFNILFRQL